MGFTVPPTRSPAAYPEGVFNGLTIDKLMIIAVIAVIIIGPHRLPAYAARLAKIVKRVRAFADGAKERLREEMGPEYDEIDWKKLDPRQYDPRRIIRDALLDDEPEPMLKLVRESAYAERQRFAREGRPAPYDSEAT
jgi:sec-independent protein translocase protein TatB